MNKMHIFFLPLIADVSNEIFDKSIQSHSASIRISNDGLKCVMGFIVGQEPFEFVNKNYGPYSEETLLEELAGNPDDWKSSDPDVLALEAMFP